MNRISNEDEEVLISVIMPAYNAEKYIGMAIKSILEQTYRKFELLIIDDGSTDGTIDIIKQFAECDNRIRFISRKNKGLPKTLNELIEMSNGKYLARMDADDYSYPQRFEKQLKYMEEHDEITVLGTLVRQNDCNAIGSINRKMDSDLRKVKMLFENVGVAHPTAFIRKAFLELNDIKYNERIRTSEDYYLWIDVINYGGVIDTLEEVLLDYRVSDNQVTRVLKDEMNLLDIKARLHMLKGFGDYSERQKEIFTKLKSYSVDYKPEDVEDLFDTILINSKTNKVCDESLIGKELSYQWVLAAIIQAKNNHCIKYWKLSYLVKYKVFKNMRYILGQLKQLRKKEYSVGGYI